MSVEKPATLANVPISRNSGTVARSALDSTPVGSLTSSVTAGPHPACNAKPTTPTIIIAKPMGTCSTISTNSAPKPSAPISSGPMALVPRPMWRRISARETADVERDHDALHRSRDPQNCAASVPEGRGRNFQHIGALAGQDEFPGIDPELPRHKAKHDGDDDVGQQIEIAAERGAERTKPSGT